MPIATDPADTQPAVDPGSPAGTPPETQPASEPESYFLDVDDRHRYRTADDAKKAVSEAGQRIAELTPYHERLSQYGIERPEDIDELVNELLDLREKAKTSTAQPQTTPPAAPKEGATAPATGELSDNDKAAIAYLKKLGFISKEEADKLQAQLKAVETRTEESQKAHEAQIVEAGRAHLASLVKAKNLPEFTEPKSGKKISPVRFAESWIRDYMEENSVGRKGEILPGSLLDRFWQGGESAQNVVEEVFEIWHAALFPNAAKSPTPGTPNSPKKIVPKPLPDGSTATPSPEPAKKGGSLMGASPELHNRAWEILQKAKKAE